jgi:maltose O-acetyltransferase
MYKKLVINGNIPDKNYWSYILLLFPGICIVSFIRKIIVSLSMVHCSNVYFEPGFRFYYGYNIFAKNVGLGSTLIMDYGTVTIGEGTSISKDCKIITAKHKINDKNSIIVEPVTIGKNVVLATNVIVLSGVTIGDNTVIGAGSVVTHDIPSNYLAAGNPAEIIRKIV